MSLSLRDRVKETTITTGTGTITLVSAPSGFRRFNSVLSDGDTTYYCIESGAQWEVGIGTYSANTLARTTVLASSNANALINISASRSFVFITYAAAKAVYKDSSDRIVSGSAGIYFNDGSVQTSAATSADLSPYLLSETASSTYVALGGSYSNPTWITDLAWSKLSGLPSAVSNLSGTNSGDQDLSGYATTTAVANTYLPLVGGTLVGDLKFTDATYDIGKSGATRPRDGWFSRKLNVGSGISLVDNSSSGWGYALLFDGTNSGIENAQGVGLGLVLRGNTISLASSSLQSLYASNNLTIGQTDGPHLVAGGAGIASTNIAYNRVITRSSDGLHIFNNTLTSSACLGVYETWTSSTSFGRFQIKPTGSSYQIGSAVGSAGGTNRAIEIGHYSSGGTFTSALSVATSGATTFSGNITATAGTVLTNTIVNQGAIYLNSYNAYMTLSGSGASSTLDLCTQSSVRVTNFAITAYAPLICGAITITQPVSTTGSPTAFTITGAAHTTLTTAEVTDGYFNATRTINFGATGGTIASQRTWRFTAPTFTATAATTLTTMSTVSISGPPVASTLVTGTNKYSLNIESGTINIATYGTSTTPVLSFGGTDFGIYASTFGVAFKAYGAAAAVAALNSGLIVTSGSTICWSNTSSVDGTRDLCLWRGGPNILDLQNSTNAQTFRLAETWTSSTSFGAFQIKANAGAAYQIGSAVGSAGGTNRSVDIGRWDSSSVWQSSLLIDPTNFLVTVGSTQTLLATYIQLTSNGQIRGNSGNITLTDHASATTFGLLCFGGTTSSYPAWKRSSATLAARLADDSADAAITCGAIASPSLTPLILLQIWG